MLLIACALLVWAAQLPPTVPRPRDAIARDTTATPAATGIIRGRVTDRESGEPLARVLVMLVPLALTEDPRSDRGPKVEPRITISSVEGRFEFRHVAAGEYSVTFDPSELRGTHLRQAFGEHEPADELSARRPPRLVLGKEEERDDVNVVLFRALAIEGRVLDEFGEPMANVAVSAHPWLRPTETSTQGRLTDDRGAFRLFGLRPGHYQVCARSELLYP